MKWIKCKTKLPPEKDMVLTYYYSDSIGCVSIGRLINDKWYTTNFIDNDIRESTSQEYLWHESTTPTFWCKFEEPIT